MLLKSAITLILVSFILYSINAQRDDIDKSGRSRKILSRKRRYVAFPEGSSFSVAVCTTIGVIGNPNVNYLSYALNWGVAYDLPNETWVIEHANGFKKTDEDSDTDTETAAVADTETTTAAMSSDTDDHMFKTKTRRIFRRDLYRKLEVAIDGMGYDGKECILKALCESNRRFTRTHSNMLEEMLKTIFRFPKLKSFLKGQRDEYDLAFKSGKHGNCRLLYPNCHFSVLDLALGKYSVPHQFHSHS